MKHFFRQPSECCPWDGHEIVMDGDLWYCKQKAFVTVAVNNKETVKSN